MHRQSRERQLTAQEREFSATCVSVRLYPKHCIQEVLGRWSEGQEVGALPVSHDFLYGTEGTSVY